MIQGSSSPHVSVMSQPPTSFERFRTPLGLRLEDVNPLYPANDIDRYFGCVGQHAGFEELHWAITLERLPQAFLSAS